MPAKHELPTDPDRPGRPAGAASRLGLETQRKRPLITAMEIENFKGIGRPVRIDLRPITLLFGRNSAGKSTILHAVCYAHEILSQHSVGAGKTTLGGEQVDLGSFRRFVHAQDTGRRVHLTFEIDLAGRSLSGQLHTDDMQYLPIEKDELDQAADTVTSGWLKLRIGWNQRLKTPSVESYAVGVDEDCVGRIETAAETDEPSLARFLPNLQHSVFTGRDSTRRLPSSGRAAGLCFSRPFCRSGERPSLFFRDRLSTIRKAMMSSTAKLSSTTLRRP